MYIDVVQCSGKDYCRPQDEIEKFFSTSLFQLMQNQIRFDSSKYGPESIILESRLDVIKMGEWKQRYAYSIQQQELLLQDLVVNLDELTLLKDSRVFKLERQSLVPFKEEKDLVQGVQIDLDANLIVVQRDGYTILDILADVGGIQGLLISAICLFLNFWNYNHLENYLAIKLFKFDHLKTSNSGADDPTDAIPSQT